MRVLLISSNTASSPYPVYPLGLSMVASATEAEGHEVQILDLIHASDDDRWNTLAERLHSFGPHVVGISVRNLDNVNMLNEERYLQTVGDAVSCVREHSTARVVLGGSAFSILPDRIMELTGADYGIVGEGEVAFPELLSDIHCGQAPPRGSILRGEQWLNTDDIPSASYDPELLQKYLADGSVASVQTKRGCPRNCVYCSYPALEGKSIRNRTPTEVVNDIHNLKQEHGASYLFFTDSVFNDCSGHYLAVLHEMERRGISIPWSAFFSPLSITEEAVDLMKRTGLQAAEIGTDAACNTTLRGQHKSFLWKDVVRANEMFQRAGVATAHYFMFGGPEESPETVQKGIQNICSLDCSAVFVFMGIRILPDTELHEIAIDEGVIDRDTDLMEPVYYLSPKIDPDWLEETLEEAFAPLSHVLFPPDALDDKLQLLHKLGHAGALWDLLGPEGNG
ncbi:MAG: lipid biosynthesis B12-binding/radical SAM protein [Candidatus Brocadiia bacterium]